jgi:hypothetical protein
MAEDQEQPTEEYLWPNRKDRPFKPKPLKSTPRPEDSSVLDFPWDDEWDYAYQQGYFWAGDNLAHDLIDREAIEKAPAGRELYGVDLPMLYCYRHFLEISLKRLIQVLVPLTDLDVSSDINKEHGLMPLWNEAKRLMAAAFSPPSAGDDTEQHVERAINDFHQYDPSSQTFRYRRDTSGKPHEDRLPHADLRQLIKTMRGLHNYFQGCESYADEVRQWQAEQWSDVPREYE